MPYVMFCLMVANLAFLQMDRPLEAKICAVFPLYVWSHNMSTQIRVSGLQATSGQRYVSIETDMAFATLRLEQFSLANPRLAADLAEAGLLFTSKKRQDELVGEVGHIQHFEENRIAEFSGWNGKLFAMHDGKVIGTDATPVLAYRPQPDLVRERGTLADWQCRVVRPLFDQPVLALALMAAFLPPVLRLMPQAGNLTIELVGPSNTGKSAAQSVAASAYGPAHYIQTLRKTLRDPQPPALITGSPSLPSWKNCTGS